MFRPPRAATTAALILAVVLTTGPALALAQHPPTGGPTIVGPKQIDAGTPVFLSLTGIDWPSNEPHQLNWEMAPAVDPAVGQFQPFLTTDRGPIAFFWTKTRGPHTVVFSAVVNGKLIVARHDFQVGTPQPPPPPPGPAPNPQPNPTPEPKPNPTPAPSPAWQTAMGPILAVKTTRPDNETIARLYLAAIARVESAQVRTTGDLRRFFDAASADLAKTLSARYPALADAHDAVFRAQLGTKDADLDKPAALALLRAAAWAAWETGMPKTAQPSAKGGTP